MENFIQWLVDNFSNLIVSLTNGTYTLINETLAFFGSKELYEFDFNLTLFSETPILVINGQDLTFLFFGIFYTVIFITIVYKIIKKIIVKITRWNKW